MEPTINPNIQKPKRSVFKWFVILFLGFSAIVTLLIMFLVWKFTPLIKIDDETNKIQLLGGAIEMDDLGGNFTFNSSYQLKTSKGNRDLSFLDSKKISILSDQLFLKVKSHDEKSMIYDCSHQGPDLITVSDAIVFNFKETKESNCTMTIPKDYFLDIKTQNIDIELTDYQSHLDLKSVNGEFIINETPNTHYRYEIIVENGAIKNLTNSNKIDAYKIKVNLENGNVSAR